MIEIGKAVEMGLDPEGGKWVTVCWTHLIIMNHATRRLARLHVHEDNTWMDGCEECEAS